MKWIMAFGIMIWLGCTAIEHVNMAPQAEMCLPPGFDLAILHAPVWHVELLTQSRVIIMYLTGGGLVAIGWERGEMMLVDMQPDNRLAPVYIRQITAACAWDHKVVGTTL